MGLVRQSQERQLPKSFCACSISESSERGVTCSAVEQQVLINSVQPDAKEALQPFTLTPSAPTTSCSLRGHTEDLCDPLGGDFQVLLPGDS